LLGGGLFLIGKATHEIYEKMEVSPEGHHAPGGASKLGLLVLQIMVLDIVFSLDSVITAVGMAQHFPIMVIAMVAAVIVMLAFSTPVANFVNNHPSMKILALSFLLLVGVLLTAEGFGQHIDKGYIYFAMAFSLLVELVNMRVRRSTHPVELNATYEEQPSK
jgi:predicted tellurium resistance membrane protein TerC